MPNTIQKTQKEGVVTITGDNGELLGVLWKDLKSHNNVLYKCVEMDTEEIQALITKGNDTE